MADAHEEEILGKAYDTRLMRRLLTYLRPYRWQVALALVSITIRAVLDILGPILTMVAIDKYLAPHFLKPDVVVFPRIHEWFMVHLYSPVDTWLGADPFT